MIYFKYPAYLFKKGTVHIKASPSTGIFYQKILIRHGSISDKIQKSFISFHLKLSFNPTFICFVSNYYLIQLNLIKYDNMNFNTTKIPVYFCW